MEKTRREFLKEIAFYSSATYLASLGIHSLSTGEAHAAGSAGVNFGECKSVKIKAISELGWWDNKTLIGDIMHHGGLHKSQWEIPWTPKNAAGSCSLIEVTALDGKKLRILIDTGWNLEWMRKRFKEEGIDKMLKTKKLITCILPTSIWTTIGDWRQPSRMTQQSKCLFRVPFTRRECIF